MYRPHAAREDTVLFAEFRLVVSPKELDEIGERFEEVEHQQLGKTGFEDTVRTVAAIEATLGIDQLATFTPA
jgi:hypothetical protein